jgi:hypothetical protein
LIFPNFGAKNRIKIIEEKNEKNEKNEKKK